ncbi:MAG: cohesin domain-containing protein [Acidobacteriota bacterium]
MKRRFLSLVALAVLLLLGLACSGGGGGGSPTEPTPTPTPTQPSITFTPQSPGPSGISLVSGSASTATTLILEVRATSVSDLYGVAFDLTYPANLLQHVRSTQGPMLAGGTFQGSVTAGRLVMGLSNLGPVPGASGSGVLMTFEFRAVGSGEGTFTFSKNQAVDSQGQAIAGLTWSAGTVRVTQ